jgi:hypothetical protein
LLKTYRFSIITGILLAVINAFHYQVERLITSLTGRNFASYIIYAVFFAFFLVVLFKVAVAKKNRDIGVVLLTAGLMFFFLLARPMLEFKLTLLEMFLLGIIIAWEGKKNKSPLPFLILALGAVAVELASNFSIGSHFYLFDAWRNMLAGLSGYLSGSLLN